LAIDTATATCSIAIGKDGEVAGEATFAAGRSHLELLLPSIDRLLADCGFDREQLDSIIVGTGPGTFSGLRVGIATARAMSQALILHLAGSGSLNALAAGLMEAGGATGAESLLPVIDARRGQVFARLFSLANAGKPVPQSEIMCLSPGDLLSRLKAERRTRVLAAGDGVQQYHSLFSAASGVEVPCVDDDAHLIKARFHLPPAGATRGYDFAGLLDVTPVYVREPDADKTVLLRKREPWLE